MNARTHALLARTHVGAWCFALALGGLSLSAGAAKLPQWGSAGVTHTPNGFSINPNAGDLRIPVKNPGGGWQSAGNYGVQNGPTGTTYNLGMNGEVYRYQPDGSILKYPLGATGQIPLADVVAGAAGLLGGPLGIACLIGCPLLMDWLGSAGGRMTPSGALERKDPAFCDTNCFTFSVSNVAPYIGNTRVAGCNLHAAYLQSFGYQTRAFASSGDNLCYGEWQTSPPNGSWDSNQWTMVKQPRAADPGPIPWLPASMDDIAPYMTTRPPPGVIPEILNKGGDINLPSVPTVTGPNAITGPQSQTTNPDGSRTVQQTTSNFTRSGNTVTNTSNVTTTTIYNIDNSVRSSNTHTQTPNTSVGPAQPGQGGTAPTATPPETPTQCDKYPQSLGCAELDTPTAEIPKTTETITFTEESVFGSGSCPSDKMYSSVTMGRSVKVVDWAQTCQYANPLGALIIALATFAAFLIVLPGAKVDT